MTKCCFGSVGGTVPFLRLEFRFDDFLFEARDDTVQDPERLGRGLKESDQPVELASGLFERLGRFEQRGLGDRGEDLHREQGDLVVLVATDEEGDLHDGFRVVEEQLVDGGERLESVDLVLRDARHEAALGEGGEDDFEERRLELERALEDP